jgi:hypothetical protein
MIRPGAKEQREEGKKNRNISSPSDSDKLLTTQDDEQTKGTILVQTGIPEEKQETTAILPAVKLEEEQESAATLPAVRRKKAQKPTATLFASLSKAALAFPPIESETLLVVVVLLIALLAHGVNMFHYPYFEDDEGTYMSQAWAVVHLGKLAYYTYWYDHAPAGWLQIALWTVITGGSRTFGTAIDSGRILMLLMQLGSTWMLYRITRTLSRNVIVAVIAAVLFAISPYGIYFHRRVLLDDITTFWMLLNIFLLVTGRITLNRIWLSALAMSISILSKEITVFLVPATIYLVFVQSDKSHRWFAVIGWITLLGTVLSLYPLMAILNNELFPTGTFLGGNAPHVSLLGSLAYQASRGKDGGIFNYNSGFWIVTRVWIQDDPILVIFGTVSAVLSVPLVFSKKDRLAGIMGLLTLSFWVFMARGGEVIKFYLVPLLPLLALNLGLMLGLTARAIRSLLESTFPLGDIAKYIARQGITKRIVKPATIWLIVEQGLIILCLAAIVLSIPPPSAGYDYGSPDISDQNNPLLLWNGTQADAQTQADAWIVKHVPVNSRMVIDEYMWNDLYENGFRYVHYYWKVETDPAIRDTLFHDNWRNFDYVATTPQMLVDMQTQNMKLVRSVIEHSTPITYFDTGGWRIEIRKVNK